jgi:hypothetical protein
MMALEKDVAAGLITPAAAAADVVSKT